MPKEEKMKKIFCAVLCAVLLFSAVGAVGVCAFGNGAAVVAKDVTMIKTGLSGQKISFSDADFKCALCISDFKYLTVTKLPSSTEGTLSLGGRRVNEGQTIKRRSLAALVFIPASKEVKEASFYFKVEGQSGDFETLCLMKFIDKVNYAPSVPEAVTSPHRCTV